MALILYILGAMLIIVGCVHSETEYSTSEMILAALGWPIIALVASIAFVFNKGKSTK